MGQFIEKLRAEVGFDGYDYNKVIMEDLMDAYKPEGYEVEEVHEEFEDGGRWSNYRTTVYKVTEGDEVAYFSVCREEPATEMQDGGDFSLSFYEVQPKEKTIIVYE